MTILNDKTLKSREYIQGVQIFKSGDEATESYLLYSGQVRIYNLENGIKKEIAILKENDIFGEMALIKNKTHTYSAEAIEKSVVVVITKDILQEKLINADPLLQSLIHIYIKRIYEANNN